MMRDNFNAISASQAKVQQATACMFLMLYKNTNLLKMPITEARMEILS